MNITTRIQRTDLLRMQLYMLPRLKANWIFFGGLALGIFIWALFDQRGPISGRDVFVAALAGVGGGMGGLVAGTLCSVIFILSTSSEKSGVLGEHHFEIREDGLFERTRANEQLSRWSGILSMQKAESFILVKINGYLFHIIPRHSFGDGAEYDRFFEQLESKWRAAAA